MRYFKFSCALAIYLVVVWLSTGMLSAATLAGTGFIVSPDGYIVTNEHVIHGSSSIKVFIGYDVYEAKIIEASQTNDLALLKIPGTNLKAVAIGSSLEVQRLHPVVAMGYPAPGYGPDLTTSDGRITSFRTDVTGREGRDTLQHDAVIFGGSSGGPLFNNKGEVIGVNYAGVKGSGLQFAIPITDVLPLLYRISTFDTTQIGRATKELTPQEIDRKNKASVVYIEVEVGKAKPKAKPEPGRPIQSVLSTNPLRLAQGLINLELETVTGPGMSSYVAPELAFYEYETVFGGKVGLRRYLGDRAPKGFWVGVFGEFLMLVAGWEEYAFGFGGGADVGYNFLIVEFLAIGGYLELEYFVWPPYTGDSGVGYGVNVGFVF